jgi:hypothetical protein
MGGRRAADFGVFPRRASVSPKLKMKPRPQLETPNPQTEKDFIYNAKR